ncbi:MAG: rhomboid family intramembrane serine protease [Lentisphaerae bacterium]|nr:rhomboid family intramembrane serine protease [Lentisphaerota bacterium]
MGLALPKPSAVVKWLLILNIGAFILQIALSYAGIRLERSLGVTRGSWWQVWRFVTFQFLHDDGWHLLLNMLAVYILGTPLERKLGSRRFATFYLLCGAMAGVSYLLISLIAGAPGWVPLIGASGGVYGIILAGAVYFPHFRIIFLFFPVPIRLAAVIIFSIMVLTVLQGLGAGALQRDEFWSETAHFGGAVTAAVWIFSAHRRAGGRGGPSLGERFRRGQWERKMRRRREIQQEIDGILAKIHTHGIASLSAREKRLLKQATEMQREEDDRIKRL